MKLTRRATWRAALAAAVLATASPHAAAEWRRFDSAHFTPYTEREAIVAQDLVRQLEHLHWLGQKYLGAGASAPGAPPRFAIYELPGRIALRQLFSSLPERTDGVYTWCAEGAAAYGVHGQRDNGFISWGQTVLQHEYAHHLMFSHASVTYPLMRRQRPSARAGPSRPSMPAARPPK